MNLQTLTPARASHEVAGLLRSRIQSGEWGVGFQLPPQRQLSELLGVGRQAVREGLGQLEAEGFLITRRGAHGGSFVQEPSTPIEVWRALLLSNLPDLDDLLDFRSGIEQRMCTLAATRRTASDLEEMSASIDALPISTTAGTVVSYSSFREADSRFHTAVGHAAKNPRLNEASRKARAELFMPTDHLPYEQRVEVTRNQHTDIYRAIEAGDAAGAAKAAMAHLEETRRNLYALVGEEHTNG